MRFTKMHGAGNDYVYVDCFREPVPDNPAQVAREVSDRHFGIGADGLILICPSEQADARMRMFNADGSEAEMCGNGVRCVAKYVYDHGICPQETLRIETGNGVLTLELDVVDGKTRRVCVDMGEPILEPERIPVNMELHQSDSPVIDEPYGCAAHEFGDHTEHQLEAPMTCVSMGNPHTVFFVDDIDGLPWHTLGESISEHSSMFPERVNVHFVERLASHEVRVVHWERGSGPTLACGTGACAVCVAGALTNRTARKILAHLPGGDLELHWADDNHVYMTGPAVEVFSGEWQGSGQLVRGRE
jgi:diaminopimelate epimerase